MLTQASCVLLLLLLLLLLVAETGSCFPRKNCLIDTSHTRVGCLVHSSSVSVRVIAYIIACDSAFFSATFVHCALNAHGNNASPDGLCARAHTNETFSCGCGCKT